MASVSWAFVVLFVVVTVGPGLIGARVFLGSDLLLLHPPWSGLAPPGFEPENVMLGDTVDAVTPASTYARERLLRGDFPLWDPLPAGGAPLLSVPNLGMASPVSWAFVALPPQLAPAWTKLTEIVAIALGMALLFRRWGLASAGAAVATLTFSASGFFLGWVNWPQSRVASLVPFLFWATDLLSTNRRLKDALPLGLVIGAMLLGGFPAVTGWALYAAIAYAAVRAYVTASMPARDLVRAALLVIGALGIGVALAAWQIAPFLHQYVNVIDTSYRQVSPQSHLPSEVLATSVVPRILGSGLDGEPFWGPPGSRNPVEAISFVAVAAVVLAVAMFTLRLPVRWLNALRWYLFVSLFLTITLTYFGAFFLRIAIHFPVFSDNYVGRLRFLIGFFFALAAGVCFSLLISRAIPSEQRIWARVAIGGVGASVALAIFVRRARDLSPGDLIQLTDDRIATAAALAGLAGLSLLILLSARQDWMRWLAALTLPTLILVQASVVGRDWWPQTDPAVFYPEMPTHKYLAENLGSDRFMSRGLTMLPSSATFYGLRAVNGHTFHRPEWADMLVTADPQGAFSSPTYSQLGGPDLVGVVSSPVLDRLATRFAVVSPGEPVIGRYEEVATADASMSNWRWHAGNSITRQVSPGGLRGVIIPLAEPIPPDPEGAVTVRVRDVRGRQLAEGERSIRGGETRSELWVPVAMESLGGTGPLFVEASVRGASVAVPAASDGGPALTIVRPADDGLELVHTGDATIYKRLNALPRFRWASQAMVVPDGETRLDLLASGALLDSTAVLTEDVDLDLSPASTAKIEVIEDSGDRIRLLVETSGAGLLVVADSIEDTDWRATIDGVDESTVPIDHAASGVPLSAGTHEVTLEYRPTWMREGILVSVIAAALVIAALCYSAVRSRSRPLFPRLFETRR